MKKLIFISGIIIAVIVLVIMLNTTGTPGEYDEFAKCLSDKEVKMYGAYWCPHCQSQKEMFDKSWKYVNYVECSLPDRAGQKIICKEDNVKVYPTWEFQGGRRIEGKLSLGELSQNSGCELKK